MNLEVLYKDSYCIVVNKPNNVLIHNSYYARNIKEKTLLDLLEEMYGQSFYPVHRLDRKTSGVLVLCTDKKHIPVFQKAIQSKQTNKTYTAIVRGFFTEDLHIDSPVKNPDTGVYKEALTICIPINTVELPIAVHPYNTARYSLVYLLPKTGRMHQLRIHMNKISHPIVGDFKYGDRFHNRMFSKEYGIDMLFLHAKSLELTHPITNTKMTFEAAFNQNWYEIFERFNWQDV